MHVYIIGKVPVDLVCTPPDKFRTESWISSLSAVYRRTTEPNEFKILQYMRTNSRPKKQDGLAFNRTGLKFVRYSECQHRKPQTVHTCFVVSIGICFLVRYRVSTTGRHSDGKKFGICTRFHGKHMKKDQYCLLPNWSVSTIAIYSAVFAYEFQGFV